jgi:uncharacterized protein YbbC (DUF1343 family)
MNRRRLLAAAGASAFAAACANTPEPALRPPTTSGPAAKVSLGIDELIRSDIASLQGQRVGFITNQTSVTRDGAISRKVLQDGLGDRLTALFGPEHGLNTNALAGDHVDNAKDQVTGLMAYSLYGAHRKPTPAMLEKVDTLVFDIQDIGVRSYTYISTMALAMEAAGEAGKAFVVLDRPNPMGGQRVQGPPLEPGFESFVSQVPVPYVHGLTIGELAQMMIAKDWIKAKPALTVVPMQGWKRSMHWGETGLNWIATSPNIPFWISSFYCAVTGILGELKEVDIGIATPKAFKVAAARGIDGAQLARDLADMGFKDVRFSPYSSTAKPGFGGVELEIDPNGQTDLMALAMALLVEVNKRAGGAPLVASTAAGLGLFDKVYGSPALQQTLRSGGSWQSLVDDWPASLRQFEQDRRPYLLYS